MSIARTVCLVQLGIASAMALLVGMIWGLQFALAALYGALTAILPTLYFAFRLFVRSPQAAPAEVVGAAFRGEIGKLVMTAVLFWLGVAMFAPQFLALLATYAACLLAYWPALARVGFDGKD